MKEQECRECVERVLAGDVARWEELDREFRPQVRSLLGGMLWDDRDADETTEDVLLAAWKKLGTYDRSRGFWPWLRGIAEREGEFRMRGRARHPLSLDTTDHETAGPSVPGPAEAYGLRTRDERLHRALDRLCPRQREALLLFCDEGMPQAEIAERMHCTVGAVEQLLQRALHKMRRLLGEPVPAAAQERGDDGCRLYVWSTDRDGAGRDDGVHDRAARRSQPEHRGVAGKSAGPGGEPASGAGGSGDV
jgi:RNA polymerase sigma-70 factor (ECF subfamily)